MGEPNLFQWSYPGGPLPPKKLTKVDWKKRWIRPVTKVGLAFGLPPRTTCPGYAYTMKHHKDEAICNDCYASKGRGYMHTVKQALEANLHFTKQPDFVPLMTRQILSQAEAATKRSEDLYIRIHWAGDFYSAEYAQKWFEICETVSSHRTPTDVWVWVATRAWVDLEILEVLQNWQKEFPVPGMDQWCSRVKVAIRPSTLKWDQVPLYRHKAFDGLLMTGAGVTTAEEVGPYDCPATLNHSTCVDENCRRCWEGKGIVMYRRH